MSTWFIRGSHLPLLNTCWMPCYAVKVRWVCSSYTSLVVLLGFAHSSCNYRCALDGDLYGPRMTAVGQARLKPLRARAEGNFLATWNISLQIWLSCEHVPGTNIPFPEEDICEVAGAQSPMGLSLSRELKEFCLWKHSGINGKSPQFWGPWLRQPVGCHLHILLWWMQIFRKEKVTNDQVLPRVDSQQEGSLANLGGNATSCS